MLHPDGYGERIDMVRNMGQMMDLHEDSPYKTLAVRKSHHLMLHSVVFLSIFLSLQAMSCDDVKYLRHAAAWQLADIAVLSIFVLPARAFFFFFFLQIMDSPRAVQVARRVSPHSSYKARVAVIPFSASCLKNLSEHHG